MELRRTARAGALLGGGAALGAAVAALASGFPPPPPAADPSPGITAEGRATVAVHPRDRGGEASIRAAVGAARRAAIPLAVAAARGEARSLALAAGVARGRVHGVSHTSTDYPYQYDAADGTFGDGRFCGTITSRVRRAGGGTRILRRHGCRVPPAATMRVRLVLAAG